MQHAYYELLQRWGRTDEYQWGSVKDKSWYDGDEYCRRYTDNLYNV